ncbi:MAG: putative transporter ATP-binding protein [Gaiellaceae bacterium]|nr:putative transporter ATP-binding protein [Gaiellaceae bacterium]
MTAGTAPVLRAEGLRKRFGGVQALAGATLELRAGEVHGLCGENGSGKSTLLRIVSAQIAADDGRLLLDGRPAAFRDPAEALAAGIATVTQETTLVPELSVAENIFLGPRKPRTWRGIDWRDTRHGAAELLARLNCDIDLGTPAGRLRPDLQQLVEIARALSTDARVLILDEPTSSLADDEVDSLFAAVRALKESGVATVFVSHRLNEVFSLADRVTVLRDGSVVGSGPIGDFDQRSLIHLMIGRELEELELDHRLQDVEDAALRVRGLSVPGRVHGVSLNVRAGEVVGLAGLVGAGRSDLFDALFGLAESSGEVEVAGRPFRPSDPHEAMKAGLAYVPADRKRLGLVLDMSVRENLVMAKTSRLRRYRRPRRAREQAVVDAATRNFRIVAASSGHPVSRLSGGNQQKVVLAKWLETEPQVLLLDEPTRGVDVGAKAEIYTLLDQAKQGGLALLVSSSETSELQLLCDRILVMYRGRIVARLSREEADDATIARFAMGHGT